MNEIQRLLFIDDDTTALNLMKELLESRGYQIDTAESVNEAEQYLDNSAYRVVVTDLKMPDRSGMELLHHCMEQYPEIPVIMITGHGSIRNAVEALKAGAFEYLSKPVQMDELILTIEKAINHRKLVNQNIFLKEEIEKSLGFHYQSNSPGMMKIYETIHVVRDEMTSVLISGESGTGKEVVARLIHSTGKRSSGNFVPINCGAIPENLIESELFGYEKGAFTGAEKRTAGKLEIADGGTLFLDEVNELPPKAQVALLRFIQERELTPLGSNRRIPVNVRIIAATNSNLEELVRDGEFRQDLYYRINVLPVFLPPLRERKEDIIPLANWILTHIRTDSQRLGRRFSPEAEELFLAYHWPGNIRELRNVIDRGSIICRKAEIDADALMISSAETRGRTDCIDSEGMVHPFEALGVQSLKDLEDDYIAWVIEQYDGNRTKAAQALGVSVRGLRYRLNSNDTK